MCGAGCTYPFAAAEMSRATLNRRIKEIRSRAPEGCFACRNPPPIVILGEDDPEPPESCEQCGRVFIGMRVVRITRVERGPQ